MKEQEERALREKNAALAVQLQDSRQRITELEDRVQGLEYAADAAEEAGERIRELQRTVAELEEENRRLRGSERELERLKRSRSWRYTAALRKVLATRG